MGLLDARYTEYTDITGANRAGLSFPFSPKATYSVAAQYTRTLAAAGSLTAAVDYSHTSKVFLDFSNTPQLAQGNIGLLGGKLTFASVGDRYEVSLYGKNLTDRQYLTSGSNFGSLIGGAAAGDYAPPRTYGVQAVVNFR